MRGREKQYYTKHVHRPGCNSPGGEVRVAKAKSSRVKRKPFKFSSLYLVNAARRATRKPGSFAEKLQKARAAKAAIKAKSTPKSLERVRKAFRKARAAKMAKARYGRNRRGRKRRRSRRTRRTRKGRRGKNPSGGKVRVAKAKSSRVKRKPFKFSSLYLINNVRRAARRATRKPGSFKEKLRKARAAKAAIKAKSRVRKAFRKARDAKKAKTRQTR